MPCLTIDELVQRSFGAEGYDVCWRDLIRPLAAKNEEYRGLQERHCQRAAVHRPLPRPPIMPGVLMVEEPLLRRGRSWCLTVNSDANLSGHVFRCLVLSVF